MMKVQGLNVTPLPSRFDYVPDGAIEFIPMHTSVPVVLLILRRKWIK